MIFDRELKTSHKNVNSELLFDRINDSIYGSILMLITESPDMSDILREHIYGTMYEYAMAGEIHQLSVKFNVNLTLVERVLGGQNITIRFRQASCLNTTSLTYSSMPTTEIIDTFKGS